MTDLFSVDKLDDYTFEQIRGLVDNYSLLVSNSRVIGVYVEGGFGANIGPGGEYLRFIGYDTVTGEKVIANYAGASLGASYSAAGPVSGGGGIFAFTGEPSALGGWSVGAQILSGVTAGVSTNIDGSGVLALAGANISVGASFSGGYTYSVEVDGQDVYYFGTVNRRDYTLDEYEAAMTQLVNVPSSSPVTVYSHRFDVSSVGGPKNGTLVEEYYRYGDDVYVKRYVVDENGQRITSLKVGKLLKEMWDDHGWVQFSPTSGEIMTIHKLSDFSVEAQPDNCFPSGTMISMWPKGDGKPWKKAIEKIVLDDKVLSFDPANGKLVPGEVIRLFSNTSDHFLKLEFADGRKPIHVTEGHHFLTPDGDFREIGHMVSNGIAEIVMVDGSAETVSVSRVVYSAETAHLFEEAQTVGTIVGNLATKPAMEPGWQTYNFEVDDLHTYVAERVREAA